jgi:hypothetical protein
LSLIGAHGAVTLCDPEFSIAELYRSRVAVRERYGGRENQHAKSGNSSHFRRLLSAELFDVKAARQRRHQEA